MSLLESAVEKKLVNACRKTGIKSIKGKSRNCKGFPDRIVFNTKKHEVYYIEIKNQTYYEQQATQKDWQKIIEASGAKYFLIDGDDEMNVFIKEHIK